eukprot:gnl/MRDRNA2_/MRDRNA2_64198_c0_seq1.p1 gnl/MRDRNA2_/MRDRNA2_64198_c0~~gnl/MRDRNA2_/MRDRNA2_64198_c0_seq1.p1  ORF type:complete len:1572 (-),score=284.08 gnl/MRDRNA2_/MRDRNA2_64198_c0_seq1:8-4213(-)
MSRAQKFLCRSRTDAARVWNEASEVSSLVSKLVHGEALDGDQLQDLHGVRLRVCHLCSALITSATSCLKRNISSKSWLLIPLLSYMLRCFSSSQSSPWQRLWALEQASHLGTILVNLITKSNTRVRRSTAGRHSFLLHWGLLSPIADGLGNICFANGHRYFLAPKHSLDEPKHMVLVDDSHDGTGCGEPLLGWPCPASCVPPEWFAGKIKKHYMPKCWSNPLAVRIKAANVHSPSAPSPSRLVYGIERVTARDSSLKLEFSSHPLKQGPGNWAELAVCGQKLSMAKLSDECEIEVHSTAHMKQLRDSLTLTSDQGMVLRTDVAEIGIKAGWAVVGHSGKSIEMDVLVRAALDPRRVMPIFDVQVPSRQAFMKTLYHMNLHSPFKRNLDSILLPKSARPKRLGELELVADIQLEDAPVLRKGWQLLSSDPLTTFLKNGNPLEAYGQVEFKTSAAVKEDFELCGGDGQSVHVKNVAEDGQLIASGMTSEAQLQKIGHDVEQFWMKPAERVLEGGILCCVTIDFWEGRRFVGKVQCSGEGSKDFELCSERIEGTFSGEDPASPKPELQEHVKVLEGPEFLRRCKGRILIRSLNACNRIIPTKIVVTKTFCPDADGDYVLAGPSLKRVRYDSRNDFLKDLKLRHTEEGVGIVEHVESCGFAERAGVKIGSQLLNLAGCSENVMSILERGLQASDFPCTAGFIDPKHLKYPLYRCSRVDGRHRPAEIRYDLELKEWQLCVSERPLYTCIGDSVVVPSNRWELKFEEVAFLPKHNYIPGILRPNEIAEVIGRANGPTPENPDRKGPQIKVRAANGRTGWYNVDLLEILEDKQDKPKPMFWTASRATKDAVLMDGNIMRLELPGIAYPTVLSFRDLSPMNLTFKTFSHPVHMTFATGDFCRLKMHLENDVVHDPSLKGGELPIEVHFQQVGDTVKGSKQFDKAEPTILVPNLVSLHVVLHPPGVRISVGDAFSSREGTVQEMTDEGLYKVRFDGEDEGSAVELPLLCGDHKPAGMFRYAEGQGLMVHIQGFGINGAAGWTDGVVDCIAEGNRHRIALRRDGGVRWLDLGLGNHAPGWLPASSFEGAARRYCSYILSRHAAITSVITVWPEDIFLQTASLTQIARNEDGKISEPQTPTRGTPTSKSVPLGLHSERIHPDTSKSLEAKTKRFQTQVGLQTTPADLEDISATILPEKENALQEGARQGSKCRDRFRTAPVKRDKLRSASTEGETIEDQAWELLTSLTAESPDRWRGQHPNPCFLVFGEVASGKTRLASWLATLCVRSRNDLVPIVVPARRLSQMMQRGGLGWDLVRNYLNKVHGEGSERELFLRQAMYARRVLLIFDGLSEAGPSHKVQIEKYICSLASARHRVMCTSRPGGCNVKKLEDAGFISLELGPLTQEHQEIMAF